MIKPRTSSALLSWATAAMSVGAGFSAFAFLTLSHQSFAGLFGHHTATALVAVAFLSGLGAGSAIIGKYASTRIRGHLLWFGAFELAIALCAAMAASLGRLPPSLRFVSAFILVGIPSTLMGGTLPVLVEGLKRRGLTASVNVLYVLNVVGAALGTLLSAYLLLPKGSLPFVLDVVLAINCCIFLAALILQFLLRGAPVAPALETSPAAPLRQPDIARRILILAALSGFVTFSNEVYWYHLLGLVVGTSVYAYAIMLFTTLLGMSLGGVWAQRVLSRGGEGSRLLLISQLGLALATLACIPFWDRIPDLFTRLELIANSFVAREGIRFLASCLLILPASICAGLTFPVLLFEVEKKSKSVGAALGRLTAVNTAGTVVGSLMSGFVILSLLGGRRSLFLSALISIAMVAVVPGLTRKRMFKSLALGLAGWMAAAILMPDWDVKRLLSGANIYFGKAHDDFDSLVWQHEDYVGGVTSVIRTGKTLTLLTHGKFQGNDGSEVRDQRRFALIPNLFVEKPRRALNIGVGTATTLGVIARFPYLEIDAVELSPDIIYAAKAYFGSVNDKVLEKSKVAVHLEDGRNFLALNRADRKYDLISIELTSIWFAGAGNLFSDEFYALAKANMSEEGVLQQWIQLHHVSEKDIAVIMGTLRSHFRYVEMWLPSHQGILVASNRPLHVVEDRLVDLRRTFPQTDFFAQDYRTVLGEMLLTSDQVDQFLADAHRAQPLPMSTDQNLYLEFSTPRGNVLGWNYDENLKALFKYSQPDWPGLLGPLAQSDPSLVWLGTIGRANFAARNSPQWHLAIDHGLSLVPEAERGRVKAALLVGLGVAPPAHAREGSQ